MLIWVICQIFLKAIQSKMIVQPSNLQHAEGVSNVLIIYSIYINDRSQTFGVTEKSSVSHLIYLKQQKA